jgi:hypothetical protein
MLAGVLWVPLYGQKVGHGWLYGKGVFMPDRFGWPVAVAGTLFSLVLFYIFVTWIERKSKAIA